MDEEKKSENNSENNGLKFIFLTALAYVKRANESKWLYHVILPTVLTFAIAHCTVLVIFLLKSCFPNFEFS